MTLLAVITFVRTYWKLAALGVLALLLAVQTVRLGAEKNVSDNFRVRLREVVAERDSLIAAAKEAERLNAEQVKRIEADQQRITDDVEADLTARLERLRSELRPKAAQSNPAGPKAGSNGPGSPEPADPAKVCISPEQFLLGAEYEEKLQQWINWYERQLGVNRN